ncbi:MAG: hypothetical protein QOF65_1575, partial [Thermoleophilaceae bacterium]|nr:hypothetical protein [Thermoleophilaceae bacterium]
MTDAPGATLPDELDQSFLPPPVSGPAAAPRALVGALMTGRGLVLSTLVTDAVMLLLAAAAALVGARAAHIPSGGSA